jgi:NAD(P)-dependent dehydrogenase (short-subunit alcohol dehydrogenase family)
MKLEDAVVLVTGANRGLGLEFARQALARGAAKVYAGARDPSKVTLPGVIPVKLDVTDAANVAAVAEQCKDVTLVVNNAGIARLGGVVEGDPVVQLREHLETNVFGVLNVSRAFAGTLGANGGGALINVLSLVSWINAPVLGTYSVSKAAAWSLTNGLRHELKKQGTQVVGLHVGFIDTDLAAGFDAPKVTTEHVVNQTYAGLEAGAEEVTADDASVHVKSALSQGVYLAEVDGA